MVYWHTTIRTQDPSRVQALYEEVQGRVAGNIAYLLERREEDPYKELVPRLLYEATWGRQAPTFPLE